MSAECIYCIRGTRRALYIVVQVSEMQKPTAGVDQFFYGLRVNVIPGVDIPFDGLPELHRVVVACGLLLLKTHPQLPPAED